MKVTWGDTGKLMNHGGTKWELPQLLYADDDAVLFTEAVEELYKMVDRFDDVSRKRLLKVNASTGKILNFERWDVTV